MNTTISTTTSAMQLPHRPASSALASLGLAAALTLSMLIGVNTLAVSETAAPQLAQAAVSHA